MRSRLTKGVESAALIAVLLSLAACSRPWDTARTVVTAAAHGVNEANESLLESYEASPCETAQDPAELRECVADFRVGVEALLAARSACEQGESIVDLWEHGGMEPTDWLGWLETGAQALARLVAVLESATVPIPEVLSQAAEALDSYLEGRRSNAEGR